jgi:hypothetical protein
VTDLKVLDMVELGQIINRKVTAFGVKGSLGIGDLKARHGIEID